MVEQKGTEGGGSQNLDSLNTQEDQEICSQFIDCKSSSKH
jgi:hypothetical protein